MKYNYRFYLLYIINVVAFINLIVAEPSKKITTETEGAIKKQDKQTCVLIIFGKGRRASASKLHACTPLVETAWCFFFQAK
jgi:hypothetical protein